jgi:hypothetical protein
MIWKKTEMEEDADRKRNPEEATLGTLISLDNPG